MEQQAQQQTQQQQVQEAVARVLAAYESGKQFEAGDGPQTVEQAYAIQDGVARHLWPASRTHCWKVGAPNRDTEPYSAPIPPQKVYDSGVTLKGCAFHMIGIEAELAFRVTQPLPVRAEAYSEQEVRAALGEMCVTLELVDTRLQQWQHTSALWRLADNQISGGLVVGSGISDWQGRDLALQPVQLTVNGEVLADKRGGHPLSDPTLLLTWALNHLVARNQGLQPGDLITTGSWTGMKFIERGAEINAVFPGIGEVALTIA
ncbi:fumarylacetoacetate hydrolase family protein [Oceanimonas sp. CHS3-5]|uniref:2-keto-4-pentenoate hydratase n=1 Tax=Oceanimonas sp. CHS3-5 TaxID=3068186 RepID=UPI00274025FA|nr:fumarylacetoacetate hydrolase family protein [Oceanimonas sp. CHS3-5]MDP5290989.1 fumarylacetoacetate hydrolase family protein [Oceanimonas sp. CHS3-5]